MSAKHSAARIKLDTKLPALYFAHVLGVTERHARRLIAEGAVSHVPIAFVESMIRAGLMVGSGEPADVVVESFQSVIQQRAED